MNGGRRSAEALERRKERLESYCCDRKYPALISCQQCEKLLPVFVLKELEGEDPGAEQPEVEFHLLVDGGCQRCLGKYTYLLDNATTLLSLADGLRQRELLAAG